VITPELAAFVEGGVSIHIAACNASLEPSGGRVAAVAVDADGMHVTAYLPEAASARIVADLQANRQVALCFGRPSDDRACQIKGEFVETRAASPGEKTVVDRQWEAFLADLAQIGFPAKVTEGWQTWPAIAIRLRVTALFSQTPGPGAGAPMP
jgi:Pyridoxamine 5'-phosphate oxidase